MSHLKRFKNSIFPTLLAAVTVAAFATTPAPAQETTTTAPAQVETTSPSAESTTDITLNKEHVSIKAGDSLTLIATLLSENTKNKTIKWKSSNKEIATVSSTGKVKGKSYGTATITAVTADGHTKASCKVTVLFKDLGDASNDFYEPVYWAVDEGILSGENEAEFGADSLCTLEDAVTWLYNMSGKPKHTSKTTFKDVKKKTSYYDAVCWAEGKKLTDNIAEDGTFGVGKVCTKEVFATLLYRLAESPYVGYDGRFVDIEAGSFFKDAVNWAVENNLTDGYRNADGSSQFVFGTGEAVTKETAAVFMYNYTHAKKDSFAEIFPEAYAFPVLRSGETVSDEIYKKYSNPEYCAEVFAYYALQAGWQYEAVVGSLAFMWAEGMSANGTFTYEGCWQVTGPSGAVYDRLLDNEAWRNWVHSADCRNQMISLTSYYNDRHYATGLGYCGESNAWNKSGNTWKKTLNRCDEYLTAADIAGVAWQDINFQTQRALFTIRSCTYDPDFRDPTTYQGDAREYCARVFATVGATGFPVWYDNGQLQPHLEKVETVRPFVDAVINHTSLIEEDLK